ncbi:MAG: tRNA (N(6)-L-threonylcarbamoyladenosine(37)-C(2))-methylthiotransferase MtaB [Butyrivibrio sp.]
MKKCALHNLGCKVNSYETQAMQQMMENRGYEIVPFGEEKCDVYIINTCSVTNIADRKSRQMIHKARKINPDAVIVATGCYVESAGQLQDEDIDIVIGNNEKSRLLDILEAYFTEKQPNCHEDMGKVSEFDEMKLTKPEEHTRAYVKIQDGCNRFCSYCIIPYVRGRIRSRAVEDVIREITAIAESGCKEIVLTGIHLSSYGLDKPENGIYLIDIIEKINKINGVERIRLGSFEPKIVTEEFVARLKACDKVCPHFHLSLQSGCNTVLKRMNRRYTVEEFYEGVQILRRYFDNPAITTDVIVGFPGETEEEFNETVEFLKKVRFYELHVFKYSRRKGTVADRMPDQIPENIKSIRSGVLLAMDEELSAEYRKGYIGRVENVLLEEETVIDGVSYITGFTDSYVRVAVEKRDEKQAYNTILPVRIKELIGKDMVIGVAENQFLY